MRNYLVLLINQFQIDLSEIFEFDPSPGEILASLWAPKNLVDLVSFFVKHPKEEISQLFFYKFFNPLIEILSLKEELSVFFEYPVLKTSFVELFVSVKLFVEKELVLFI